MSEAEGLLLIKKPSDVTSFSALHPIKKSLGIKKVGHTGTLDKFASGLLVVLTGRFTSFCELFTKCDKRYEAVMRLGEQTETLDPEGETLFRSEYRPTLQELEEAIQAEYLGSISQIPPLYSAIHIDGKRASKRARDGQEVEMPSRSVTIHSFDILEYEYPFCRFSVRCSSGTYIRSLARDLARSCGAVGSLHTLERTHVGKFSLEESISAEALSANSLHREYRELLSLFPSITPLQIDPSVQKELSVGRLPKESLGDVLAGISTQYVTLFNERGDLFALLEEREGLYQFRKNFSPPLISS